MSPSELCTARWPIAAGHNRHCLLCEHRCGVDRSAGERGPCHAGVEARVFRHRVEYGEELELIPSHLFYLSGCDLRCAFCIAEVNAFDPSRGTLLTPEFFAKTVAWGCGQGARNVQWVGGEPTIHLPQILRAMAVVSDLPPIVWKSDFHGTRDAFELLDGIVSVYVADLKFGNDECARRIAGIDGYLEKVTPNLSWAAAARGDLIVRHLLLPGHWECCAVPIFQWMQDNLPGTKFSLRDGYLPKWQATRDESLNRVISRSESQQAWTLARQLNLNLVP